MVYLLESIPTPLLLLLVVGGTGVLTAALTYFVRIHVNEQVHRGNNEVAGFMFAGVSVIYGVLLAFLVLVVWQTYQDTAVTVEQEANALTDIFRIGQELPEPYGSQVQNDAIEYANRVISDEWAVMALGRQSANVDETIEKFWTLHRMMDADPAKPEIHPQELFDTLEILGNTRRIRLLDSRSDLPPLMWALLIGGAGLTIGFTFFFRAPTTVAHLAMAALFGGLLAFVLILIVELDSPFNGSIRIEPHAFQQALELFARLQSK